MFILPEVGTVQCTVVKIYIQSTQYVYTVPYIRIYPKSGIIFSHTSHDLICMHLSLSGFSYACEKSKRVYKCEAVTYFKK